MTHRAGLRGPATMAMMLALTAVVAGCSTTAAEPVGPGPGPSAGADSWMQTTFADHRQVTLGQMVIPGTHDSGTSPISVAAPCNPTFNAGESKLSQVGAFLQPCMVTGMARTQAQDVGDQLASGIRYLDLRVGVPADQAIAGDAQPPALPADPQAVPLVLQHVLVAQPLARALDQILDFSARHPKEQIILDFQHLDVPTSSPGLAAYYFGALDSYLTSYAPVSGTPVCARSWSRDVLPVPDAELAGSVSIGQAWATGRNLIVLVDPGQLPDRPCYRNRQAALLSPWPDTESPQVSSQANLAGLQQRAQRLAGPRAACIDATGSSAGQNWCGFYVSQLQLTISSDTQQKCTIAPDDSCSLFAYAMRVNLGAATMVADWRLKQRLPVNIVILDYANFSDPPYSPTLIDVNRTLLAGG